MKKAALTGNIQQFCQFSLQRGCFVLFSSLKHSVFHSWNAQRWCWMLFVI